MAARKTSIQSVTRRFQNGIQGLIEACHNCGQQTDWTRKRCMRCNIKLKKEK